MGINPTAKQNLMTVRVQVEIMNDSYGMAQSGRLSLHHEFQARAMDFGDISNLLKKYDDLSKEIEQSVGVPNSNK